VIERLAATTFALLTIVHRGRGDRTPHQGKSHKANPAEVKSLSQRAHTSFSGVDVGNRLQFLIHSKHQQKSATANADRLLFFASALAGLNRFWRAFAFVTAFALTGTAAGFGGAHTRTHANTARASEERDSRAHQDHQLFFHSVISLAQSAISSNSIGTKLK
jgi:hypothetical protein